MYGMEILRHTLELRRKMYTASLTSHTLYNVTLQKLHTSVENNY